jgi:hypothetical protein
MASRDGSPVHSRTTSVVRTEGYEGANQLQSADHRCRTLMCMQTELQHSSEKGV